MKISRQKLFTAPTSKNIFSFIQMGKQGSKIAIVDDDRNNAAEISTIVKFSIKWYQLELAVVNETVEWF